MRDLLVFLATAALVASCGGDSTAPTTLEGTWSLATVANVRVPTTQSCDSAGVYGGSLDLRTDNTYALVIHYNAPTCGTHMSYVGSGPYAATVTAVTLQGTSNIAMARDGATLTHTMSGKGYVWRK